MMYFILAIQIVFGLMFVAAGMMKLLMQEKARSMTPALRLYPTSFIYFIGAAEVAGGIGAALPVWTGILPILSPLAALGLALIMAGAVFSHLKLREYPNAAFALLVLLAEGYLAYALV